MVTTSHLRNLGYRARERFDTPIHNCQRISEVLATLCERQGIPATVHERAIGEQRVTHFVVLLSSETIRDVNATTGPTYVDPTIDQFSLANRRDGITEIGLGRAEDLPEVGIYPPEAEERTVWYHRK